MPAGQSTILSGGDERCLEEFDDVSAPSVEGARGQRVLVEEALEVKTGKVLELRRDINGDGGERRHLAYIHDP